MQKNLIKENSLYQQHQVLKLFKPNKQFAQVYLNFLKQIDTNLIKYIRAFLMGVAKVSKLS
jgi:hypothetical protein